MPKKRVNPATLAACRARNCFAVAAIDPSFSPQKSELQQRRAARLARRFRLSLATAAAVAGLAFPQREGAR